MAVNVRLRSQGGSNAGWIYVYQIDGRNGVVVSGQTYQDAGSNVLQTAIASGSDLRVYIRASYPLVSVNTIDGTLTKSADSGHYSGYVDISLPATGPVRVRLTTPDDDDGAEDTVQVTIETAPELLALSFTGDYPGSQTELKAGDSFQITGTTDKPCTGVEILDYEAFSLAVITFASTTAFTVSGTVADRGTSSVLRPARVRARDASGAYGGTRDTNTGGGTTERVHLVQCNNLYPTVVLGTPTYPPGQSALKNLESATVPVTVSNYDTVTFTSPNSQLDITDPTSPASPKTVTRISGTYNVATNNLRATAVRTANDAQTVAQTVVRIANVAATISVTEPYARLRSGSSPQDYTISIVSDQELGSAPSLDSSASPNSGTLQGVGWVGGLSIWTRVIRIASSDVPGTYGWRNLVATNRSGLTTTLITGDASYIIGGFATIAATFPPFSQTTTIPVQVTDYSKLQAGIFTATNQPSIKNPTQGNHANLINTYTVEALGVNPTTIFWNDLAAANSNSSGTAQLLNIEELV